MNKLAAMLLALTPLSLNALPLLQLDTPSGTWVETDPIHGDETIITTDSIFTVYAYLSSASALGENYIFSASVVPTTLSDGDAFGNFTVGGTSYDKDNTVFGELPVTNHEPLHAATYYYSNTFAFNSSNTLTAYNVEDNSGSTPDFSGTNMYYQAFDIDVSGLMDGMALHFDLFSEDLKHNGNAVDFAPFSHDVGSSTSIPEPGAIVLLTLGLISLSVARKKRL